ncbi:hypothetical protein PHISP_06622 [Aspergillus sp. HF37]|nr:hypothetical protein PHISP_06622 [Aspergillus sp. HF37]
MPSLLSLPPEIRTIILEHAIATPPAPPKTPGPATKPATRAMPSTTTPGTSAPNTPSTYLEYRRISRMYPRRKPPTDLSGYGVRPEWFARTLCNQIAYMLGMSYHTLYLGGILYEHIGGIRVLVDGRGGVWSGGDASADEVGVSDGVLYARDVEGVFLAVEEGGAASEGEGWV